MRFMKVYDVIPALVKPTIRAAQLHYADPFDSYFALLLRERRSVSLNDMMNDAIEVEINLMTFGKNKQKIEIKKGKRRIPGFHFTFFFWSKVPYNDESNGEIDGNTFCWWETPCKGTKWNSNQKPKF